MPVIANISLLATALYKKHMLAMVALYPVIKNGVSYYRAN